MARFTQWLLLISYLLPIVCGQSDLEGKFTISDFHKTVNIESPEKAALQSLVKKYSLRDHSHDNMWRTQRVACSL
ncbi:hypothetical protein PTKIN_Ptkin02bG0232700 [Pterospermum kingtungense]